MMDTDRDSDLSRPGLSFKPGGAAYESGRIASRQRLRLRRTTLAVVNYAVIGFYTLYLYFSGQLALDPIAEVSLYLAVVVAYSFFFWLIASGCNLHFRDPSLTWPQLTLAAGFAIYLFDVSRTLFAQDLYFFAFLMSLLFAAFRLDLKQILVTELPVFGGFAAILLLQHNQFHETFGAAAAHVAIYFVLTAWMITFTTSISHLRQALSNRNKELKQTAARDNLTGAYNRRYLFRMLEREIERSKRSGEPLCVCMFDIDHFKEINDRHGHQVGDEILRELITRTRNSIRAADELRPGIDELRAVSDGHVLSRFGGEEFLFALPQTNRAGAITCAKRVLEAIRSHPFKTRAGFVKVSASLGIAQYNSAHDTIDTLIERADAALYKAKANGRDQVVTAPIAGMAE